MIELLGPMPKNYAIAGSFFDKFFKRDPISNKFIFKNIDKLRHFPLQRLLTDKYRFKKHEADMLADFLLPMLQWYPSDRQSAKTMLEHPWLTMPDDYNYKMSDLEFQKFTLKQQTQQQEDEEEKKQKEQKAGAFDIDSDHGIGELVLDDVELMEADDEDNVSLEFEDTDDSISLTGKKSGSEDEAEF